jgi:hypothetical protein
MTLAETLTRKMSQLPVSRQLEVLNFAEFLAQKQMRAGPRHDPEGLLADQASGLDLDDFTAARREAWGEFPREISE